MTLRDAGRLALAALFVGSGVLHFVAHRAYESVVPPALGDPGTLVGVSGVAEICGGLGLLVPATRPAAAYGLVALLLAVWPSNVYMALDAGRFARLAPAWALWLRVPLQLPLIAAVLGVRRS